MTTKKIKIAREEPAGMLKVKILRKRSNTEFWNDKSFEELTQEQGTKTFDVQENGKNWPEDADFEEFIEAINSGRKPGG